MRPRALSETQAQDVMRMHAAGMMGKDIAALLGCSHATVSRCLRGDDGRHHTRSTIPIVQRQRCKHHPDRWALIGSRIGLCKECARTLRRRTCGAISD